ncbi:MAG: hypothetical protein IH900_02030 [Proteobacteria bacterium]|nr:hypothetical protein [Pseudomonadota bacterium]
MPSATCVASNPEFVPALPEGALSWLAGSLGPAERRVVREIVQPGDLAEVEGKTYLVAPVSAATIDALAAFEAEGEDYENDLCDEPSEDLELDARDLEPNEANNEPDDPQARQRFIQARRVRVTTPEWTSPSGHLVPARVEYRHDGARDYEEGRWPRLPAGAPAMGKARRR